MTPVGKPIHRILPRPRGGEPRLLERLAHLPCTFAPGEPVTGEGWHRHYHLVTLGIDEDGLFGRASEAVLTYRFYPPSVMTSVSTFSVENRTARPADRILIAVRVLRLFGIPLYEVLALNEVITARHDQHSASLVYVTTMCHAEAGIWQVTVFREGGRVLLEMDATSRIVESVPRWQHRIVRYLQKRAHRLGIAYYKKQVSLLW